MPIVSTVHIVETLERAQLLTRPQLDEVRQALGRTPASPQALLHEVVRRAWLTSFQAQQIADGRGADLQLGPYLLLDTLGAGGSGQVFKARHRKLNRLAALKVLRPELLQDTEIVQRFYREIEVASQLAHPNIVHAYEAGPIGSRLVLVMEYIDGPDLERLVRQSGPLPVDWACEYVRQVAVGLQHASERGLVHRDIKPSNLLVAPAPGLHPAGVGVGVVKLLDLGLARLQQPARDSRTADLTILGGSAVMQGTPDYMAPEQALDFHGADTRADIYSLGCTLFFLLAGRPPFAGGSLTEKLMKHQQAQPPLELVASRLPSGLAAVLGKMLAKRVLDRYQTPGAVAAALQPFCPEAETATLAACPTATALPAVAPVPRRRRLALPLGIAALLVPLIGLGVLFLSRLTDRQPTVRSSAAVLSQPSIAELPKPSEVDPGVLPVGANGKPLNLDFETGTLQDWTAVGDGDAFKGQPVKVDAVGTQRRGIPFGHQGKYWLGGYELHGDAPTGMLTSAAFKITHPWASFLLGGGSHSSTHVDLILTEDSKNLFFRVSGQDADTMRRVVVDLRPHAGKEMFIRLIDFQSGPWGHINFDDFRFHTNEPKGRR